MICSSCGREIDRKATICSFCGRETSFATIKTVASPAPISYPRKSNGNNNSGKSGQGLENIESKIMYLKKVQDEQENKIKKLISRPDVPTAIIALIAAAAVAAIILSIAISSALTNRAVSRLKKELTGNIPVQETVIPQMREQKSGEIFPEVDIEIVHNPSSEEQPLEEPPIVEPAGTMPAPEIEYDEPFQENIS